MGGSESLGIDGYGVEIKRSAEVLRTKDYKIAPKLPEYSQVAMPVFRVS